MNMSQADRRQFMKLTGAGAAGAAVGTGIGTGAPSKDQNVGTQAVVEDYFVALSDTVRIALNDNDPTSGGLELTRDKTDEWIRIDGAVDSANNTWSAGQNDVDIPDLVNVIIDLIENWTTTDVFDTIRGVISESDLADADDFISTKLSNINLRNILGAVDTEQLLKPIVEIIKGLNLPGDGRTGGGLDGAGRQIINDLGYMLGIQNTFENPGQVSDQADDLWFDKDNGDEVVALSGWFDGYQIHVYSSTIFGKDITDDVANINSMDALLTNPSVTDWKDLFHRVEESMHMQLTYAGQGDTIAILPDGIQFASNSEPRLDRIVDFVLAFLNTDESFVSDLFGGGGGDTCSSQSINCTANGPEVVNNDCTSDPGLMVQVEDFLVNELGFPTEFFDPVPLDNLLKTVSNNLISDFDMFNLSTDSSGYQEGYVGTLDSLILDQMATVFDTGTQYSWTDSGSTTHTYSGVLSEILTAAESAINIDAIYNHGSQNLTDTIDELKAVLRGELDQYDDQVDTYNNGLELAIEVPNGITGDLNPNTDTLTASIGDFTADLKSANGDMPGLVGDIFNAFLDDASDISVAAGDGVPQVIAKGLTAYHADITIDETTVSTNWGAIKKGLQDLNEAKPDSNPWSTVITIGDLYQSLTGDGSSGGGGSGGDQGTLEKILSDVLADLETSIKNDTQLGNLFDPFKEGGSYSLLTSLNLTTQPGNGSIPAGINYDSQRGAANVTTAENQFTLNLPKAIDIITGDDGNSTGLNDLNFVSQLENITLSNTSLSSIISNNVTSSDWQDLRDTVDTTLCGLAASTNEDPSNPVCQYPWGDDTDGSNSAGNEWENNTVRINPRDGASNITFIAQDYSSLQNFLQTALTDLANHVDNTVGGVENLIAHQTYGLINALDNTPGYGPTDGNGNPVAPPLQRLKSLVIEIVNRLVDRNGDGTGLIRDYSGAHVIEISFDYIRRPNTLNGGTDLADTPVIDPDMPHLVDVAGDGSIDIVDTQVFFDNLQTQNVQNCPAALNFSQISPDDKVTVFDVAEHWRQYIYTG